MEQENKPKKPSWLKSPPASEDGPDVRRPSVDPTGRGGTVGVLAGVAVIAPVLIRELTRGNDPYLLLPISLVLVAVALGGLRVAQSGKDGKLGRIGMLMAVAGCALTAVMFLFVAYNDMVLNTRLQNGISLFTLGFTLLAGGLALFGAATLAAGTLARGPVLLMMVALPAGVLLDLVGAFAGDRRFGWGPGVVLGAGLHLGMKVFGLALVWLGYSILKATRLKSEEKLA
ncbi:MAG: hypothetical protein ACT4OM_10575 [Actinomycetota bacterium]